MFERSRDAVDELGAGDTLAYLRDQRAQADAAEARLLAGVAHWADLHPAMHPDHDPSTGAQTTCPRSAASARSPWPATVHPWSPSSPWPTWPRRCG